MDLEHCMKTYPDIPLPYKTSILRDVAYGLAYNTHASSTETSTLAMFSSQSHSKSKLLNLHGVAKLLDRETAMIRTRSVCPGAIDFIAPESLEESPKYA